MASPFPGMNPYLEQDDVWEDFHSRFMTHAADTLNGRVGDNYLVKIEVRLYIHELSEGERRYFSRSDVGVTHSESERPFAASTTSTLAPVRLQLPAVDIQRELFLEIFDRRHRRVITAIEVLSPTNKTRGADRDSYLAKRRTILASRANFVEIDLRRGGVRPEPPILPQCDYYTLISRFEERPGISFWPIGLREKLPVLPVPLSDGDADVSLDLQALLHEVYDAAGYAKYVYRELPQPPLSTEDAAWAGTLIQVNS